MLLKLQQVLCSLLSNLFIQWNQFLGPSHAANLYLFYHDEAVDCVVLKLFGSDAKDQRNDVPRGTLPSLKIAFSARSPLNQREALGIDNLQR